MTHRFTANNFSTLFIFKSWQFKIQKKYTLKTSNTELENPLQAFKDFLTTQGYRVTGQRLAIFEAAYKQSDHYTAESLLDSARAIDNTVSRATIYRTLPLIVESGIVREVDVGKDYKYYMTNKKTRTFQAQVICAETDKIYEVDAPFMEWYGKAVAEKLGMEPISQRLQVVARPKKKTPDSKTR